MNSIKFAILILWVCSASIASDALETPLPLLINCGLSKSSSPWQSDDDPSFAPTNINDVMTTAAVTTDPTGDAPFKVARIFLKPVNYTFSIPPGPIFLRLYFSNTINYNNLPSYNFSTSLLANDFTLLHNFNPSLNTPDPSLNSPDDQNTLVYEFQIIVPKGENNLKLSFSPGESYGYVNGIEMRSIPEGLYINDSKQFNYVTNEAVGYSMNKNSTATQTVYRLNVGGPYVAPENDSTEGEMMRKWKPDDDYVVRPFLGAKGGLDPTAPPDAGVNYTKATPAYVAPKIVYQTTRHLGDGVAGMNLTWKFEVDPGFDYLVRLHFREGDKAVTMAGQTLMDVYIGGGLAEGGLDVFSDAGGLGRPLYRDYVITMPLANETDNKLPLVLTLSPYRDGSKMLMASGKAAVVEHFLSDPDAFLNGLEILKLSSFDKNVAVPNPPLKLSGTTSPLQPNKKSSVHKIVIIIGGIIGGLLLLSIVLLALFRRKLHYKRLFTSSKSSSKGQWLPTSISSSATTNANSSRPSLPADLCRRFSLSEMRLATSDFDEKSVIGVGGFGKVYKGCIDDGATNVAIKRLNPSSKQGELEFLTEIEMLSRLRHMHLVSLIGYCEDEGEMILVYEYMPRGTLRDHLSYKGLGENSEVMTWKQRLMICLGAARGLDYLHSGTKELIIHRDVKSTNILLDDKWTAKVSDFGLSKVGPASDTGIGHVSTAVKGSFGYLDPQYYRRQQLTEKSDVYSFGVVLFEVLCARPAINPSLHKDQVNLANWGRSCYKKGTLISIIDPNLTGQIAPECLRKYGEIAEMCVKNHSEDRPSMRDIVWSLEFALQLQETAEKNTSNGSPLLEVSRGDAGGNDGGPMDSDVFTDSTAGNLTQSNGDGVDTTTTTTTTITRDMKSGSVFSEILNPKAR